MNVNYNIVLEWIMLTSFMQVYFSTKNVLSGHEIGLNFDSNVYKPRKGRIQHKLMKKKAYKVGVKILRERGKGMQKLNLRKA